MKAKDKSAIKAIAIMAAFMFACVVGVHGFIAVIKCQPGQRYNVIEGCKTPSKE